MFVYRKATFDDLKRIWSRNIAENPGDDRWYRWKDAFIARNRTGQAATFVVLRDGEPLGEVTLEFFQTGSRSGLADGKSCGYIQALRVHPSLQGQQHASRLMAVLEDYARQMGLQQLNIGVEAADSRNLAIYLHWGYDQFRMAEEDNGELVLFYGKSLL